MGAFEKQVCRVTEGGAPGRFSRQWALNCAVDGSGCDGVTLDEVHSALLRHGAVDEACMPYLSGATHSPKGQPLGDEFCREGLLGVCGGARCYARHPDAQELLPAMEVIAGAGTSGGTQWLNGEREISAAILSYGAVVGMMDIYADLLSYRTGVYQRLSSDFQGKAAVQLLGWGMDPQSGASYWIAENSWGSKWGESQYSKPCSIQDCRGEFCPDDNSNPDCFDSSSWTDSHGLDCAWYLKNDPGCSIYVDHCGIERLAGHTFSAAYSPSDELAHTVEGPSCADRLDWNDAYGRGCEWYAQQGSCAQLPDVGQLFNCPAACGSCGQAPRLRRPESGWAAKARSPRR